MLAYKALSDLLGRKLADDPLQLTFLCIKPITARAELRERASTRKSVVNLRGLHITIPGAQHIAVDHR
jgi:DNA mismatch repair protein MutH